jgi:pimeloyl-ACP methyl ester carboxylesterase
VTRHGGRDRHQAERVGAACHAQHLAARKLAAWAVPILAATVLGGCTYWNLLAQTFAPDSPPARLFRFRDGGEAIHFFIDRRLDDAQQEPASTVFVISGSDCTSMKFFLPGYFRGLEGESGALRIVVLHKRFIGERTWGRIGGCSDAFTQADHPRRWIADYTEIIEHELALHRPRRVVLVGISEGGDVVPLLARRLPAVTHVALLGNGGMDPLDAYRIQASESAPAPMNEILAALETGRAPDSIDAQRTPGGRTWRYWTELRELQPTENLLALDIPVIVGMGEDDRSLPIEGAWRLRERFRARGKTNLTLLTYPNADHALMDGARRRSHLPDFWRQLDRWLSVGSGAKHPATP